MEYKNLENIILYLIVGCTAAILATLIRLCSLILGFDNFTANVVFFISVGIAIAVYLSINVILQRLLLPWISRMLHTTTPYNKASRTNPIPVVEVRIQKEEQLPDLDQLRKEHLQAESKKQNENRQIAICYTQTIFAPYTSDEELKRLCHYIDLYALKRDPTSIMPVKVSDMLHSTDIYHFGWNIWNHFRVSSQSAMACFLKNVFAFTLKDISDVETIKKKLRVQDGPCTIHLQSNLKKSELIN